MRRTDGGCEEGQNPDQRGVNVQRSRVLVLLPGGFARRMVHAMTSASVAELLRRIVSDPAVRFGKPTVQGTRVTVGDVLGWLASGMSEAEVLAEFPQLSELDIRACLLFAAERERRIVVPPAA